MHITAPETGPRRGPTRVFLSSRGIVLLAIALGLCGGYLDLVVMTFMKYCLNDLRYFWSGRDFPWSVPVGHALLLAVAGVLVALCNRALPSKVFTLRAAAWVFATLTIWGALVRLPLYGLGTLMLAVGLGRPISSAVDGICRSSRGARCAVIALFGLLMVLAALSSGRHAVRNYRAMTSLPAPAPAPGTSW